MAKNTTHSLIVHAYMYNYMYVHVYVYDPVPVQCNTTVSGPHYLMQVCEQ